MLLHITDPDVCRQALATAAAVPARPGDVPRFGHSSNASGPLLLSAA